MTDAALFNLGDDESGRVPSGDLCSASGLLALMSLPGIGSARAIGLAKVFGSSDAFNEASLDERKRLAKVSVEGFVSPREPEPMDESVRLVGYFDAGYPGALREVKDAPAVLWIRGSLPEPARRVAIVGTRSATEWGLRVASALATAAANDGVEVVSGLALGIDITAHRAALSAGGRTTAVLGSGLDRTTPREHIPEAEAIVESGGCVLTEQPPGTSASPRTLVARNRIQSGLSAFTVVVQCGMKSGTMATARHAMAQSRTLAVAEPLSPSERAHAENEGSLSLLRDGARVRRIAQPSDFTALLRDVT